MSGRRAKKVKPLLWVKPIGKEISPNRGDIINTGQRPVIKASGLSVSPEAGGVLFIFHECEKILFG